MFVGGGGGGGLLYYLPGTIVEFCRTDRLENPEHHKGKSVCHLKEGFLEKETDKE